jgi:hypothetical protein
VRCCPDDKHSVGENRRGNAKTSEATIAPLKKGQVRQERKGAGEEEKDKERGRAGRTKGREWNKRKGRGGRAEVEGRGGRKRRKGRGGRQRDGRQRDGKEGKVSEVTIAPIQQERKRTSTSRETKTI